ncbi:hypothetical protein D918_06566 [Trichuris suis]|nr:hypothetical protein D918_06566 [Trichuris suis]
MATTLSAHLVLFVRKELNVPKHRTVCSTDSTVAFSWIRGTSTLWKQFVGNRISEVQSLTDTVPLRTTQQTCSAVIVPNETKQSRESRERRRGALTAEEILHADFASSNEDTLEQKSGASVPTSHSTSDNFTCSSGMTTFCE